MAGLYTISRDSMKTISIGELDKLMDLAVSTNSGEMTPTQAMTVPLCFRAIDMIAGAVSRMPYYIEDQAENDVTEDNTPRYWAELMYKLAASLLLYDSAYCLKEANAFGIDALYRFLPSPLVDYKLNPATNDIAFFTYQSGAKTEIITDYNKRLMYWWWPNLQSEVGPGKGPRNAAMGDVGLAWNLTKFAEMYFKRGGFPLTILSVEGNVPDQDKILSWWNSMIAGVRRAFRAILLTNKIKPNVIGSNIKDTIAPELYDQAATNVAIAFGIPISKFIDSLKYGNATIENDFTFLTDTIVPLASRIYEQWNERVYEPQGLKIEIWPEKLEAFQSYQLKQAAAVVPLVGGPVLNTKEGRELLGYEAPAEKAKGTADQTEESAQKVVFNGAQLQAASDIVIKVASGEIPRDSGISMLVSFFGMTAQQAEQIIGSAGNGFESSANKPPAIVESPVNNNAAPDQSVTQETQDRDDAIENERKALKRYAHNRLNDGKPFKFRSDVIGLPEIEAVKALTTHDEIDALNLAAVKREYSASDIAALLEMAIKTAEALSHG